MISLFDIVTYVAGLDRATARLGGFYRYEYPDIGADETLWDSRPGQPEPESPGGTLLNEIMTMDLITVDPEDDLQKIAGRMAELQVHRVFVGTPEDLQGVISTMEVMRTIATAKRVRSGGGHGGGGR